MRISGFLHIITNPELIKRLHDNILKSVDETVTIAFLGGEVSAFRHGRKHFRHGRKHFRHGNNKKLGETKLRQKGRLQESAEANQRINQGWKDVARNQGVKTRQWKGPAENSKEGRSVRKGQSHGDSNGPTTEKGSQEKGDEDGTEGLMIIETET
nr:reverse transcriptase domain-containing protein [Tanacetum cinerariifolium]